MLKYQRWSTSRIDTRSSVFQYTYMRLVLYNVELVKILKIGKNTQDVITSLENCALVLFKWFENNLMKANSDKSDLLLSTSTSSTANINGDIITNSESEKLLGVTIDYKLNFEEHLSKVCDKASQKLNALARISSYMNINQRKRIMRAFISSQFG